MCNAIITGGLIIHKNIVLLSVHDKLCVLSFRSSWLDFCKEYYIKMTCKCLIFTLLMLHYKLVSSAGQITLLPMDQVE